MRARLFRHSSSFATSRLEDLPTQRQFREAVSSISPTQQRFAEAYRTMQLGATAFAVLVLHVKPQLERVLRVATDALTRELALTQDVVELLTAYQVPVDLLRVRCGTLDELRANVAAMQQMIAALKRDQMPPVALPIAAPVAPELFVPVYAVWPTFDDAMLPPPVLSATPTAPPMKKRFFRRSPSPVRAQVRTNLCRSSCC